jgi:branched-subunit amino acid transport protein
MNTVGRWAFLIGVVLAIVLGALGIVNSTWMSALILIGLIVGFLNISESETTPFLLAGVSLIIASALGKDVMSGISVLYNILNTLLAVFVPSTIVVAIKHVFSLARN